MLQGCTLLTNWRNIIKCRINTLTVAWNCISVCFICSRIKLFYNYKVIHLLHENVPTIKKCLIIKTLVKIDKTATERKVKTNKKWLRDFFLSLRLQAFGLECENDANSDIFCDTLTVKDSHVMPEKYTGNLMLVPLCVLTCWYTSDWYGYYHAWCMFFPTCYCHIK